jgi:hypothetical protein
MKTFCFPKLACSHQICSTSYHSTFIVSRSNVKTNSIANIITNYVRIGSSNFWLLVILFILFILNQKVFSQKNRDFLFFFPSRFLDLVQKGFCSLYNRTRMWACVCLCLRVCVCVCKREGDRSRCIEPPIQRYGDAEENKQKEKRAESK